MTIFGPATSGTATEIPEIFRKSRRETPGLSEPWFGSFIVSSSSRIPLPPQIAKIDAARIRTTGLDQPVLVLTGETRVAISIANLGG
jgi:hypothetical protein